MRKASSWLPKQEQVQKHSNLRGNFIAWRRSEERRAGKPEGESKTAGLPSRLRASLQCSG